LGENYSEPVFVKPNDIVVPDSLKNVIDEKPLSLNDQHLKVINIGLNDKMAFVKNLFGDSNEDYNRVLSQLNTFSTFEEAKDFIDEIIKPDYNNWEGVDDYSERFIEIVAKKFS
jgi:3-methyladenine DNA glycosylase AlkD